MVSNAIAWPDDDCEEVPLQLKIQAARSLAGLCTKVTQAKSRLEKKYDFVNSSSSFVVPNSSSIVSNARDLNKPLSQKEKDKIFRPFEFRENKHYCLITELKSTNTKDIESLMQFLNNNI